MTGYAADIAEFGRLADCAQHIRAASNALGTHGVLTGAAREFEESWRHALTTLAHAADDIIDRLHAAAGGYRALDEAAAERYGHIAAALGP